MNETRDPTKYLLHYMKYGKSGSNGCLTYKGVVHPRGDLVSRLTGFREVSQLSVQQPFELLREHDKMQNFTHIL